jgi:hypothetical protein
MQRLASRVGLEPTDHLPQDNQTNDFAANRTQESLQNGIQGCLSNGSSLEAREVFEWPDHDQADRAPHHAS